MPYMRTILGSSVRDCILIILFQLYDIVGYCALVSMTISNLHIGRTN